MGDSVRGAHTRALTASAAALFAALTLLLIASPVFATIAIASPTRGMSGDKNGLIAFQRVFFDNDGFSARIAIFTVKPDGTRLRQITNPPLGEETGRMRWSPDGRWLAYMWTVLKEPRRPHIFVIRSNGTHETDLTRGHCRRNSCHGEEDPAWSPEGDRIAFIRTVGATRTLFVMQSDGTRRRQVTSPPSARYADSAPAWSPDNQHLVFRRDDSVRAASALFIVRLGGAEPRRVTPWTLDSANRPDWSASGRWILFERPSPSRLQLCVIHPDGTELRHITHSRELDWQWASFAPDGTMITALRTPGEANATRDDIYVMNFDGSGIHAVTSSIPLDPTERYPPAEGLPDWGPHRWDD